MKFDISKFLYNLHRKFKIHKNLTRITGMKNSIFMVRSWSRLLRMRNVSVQICRQNQNTNFEFSKLFFVNRVLSETDASGFCTCSNVHIVPSVVFIWAGELNRE